MKTTSIETNPELTQMAKLADMAIKKVTITEFANIQKLKWTC